MFRLLRTELKELVGQKSLVVLLFLGILFLDALGAVFPNILNRQVTLFIPIPLISINYLINVKRINWLFLLSLGFNFLGLFNFNNAYQTFNSVGIIYHTIAFIIYLFIIVKDYNGVSVKRVLKLSILIILLVVVPVFILSKGIKQMFIFNETIIYVFFVTVYMISALLLFLNSKTKTYRFLLFSAVFILCSSYFQGYNLFMTDSSISEFFAVITFNLTHFFMCLFLIEKAKA